MRYNGKLTLTEGSIIDENFGFGQSLPQPSSRGRGTGGSSHLEAAPFSQPYPSV